MMSIITLARKGEKGDKPTQKYAPEEEEDTRKDGDWAHAKFQDRQEEYVEGEEQYSDDDPPPPPPRRKVQPAALQNSPSMSKGRKSNSPSSIKPEDVPLTPAFVHDKKSSQAEVVPRERFAPEPPHVVGGIRSASKWLQQATYHANGRGGTPYPTERQYLAMICEYEGVPKWWDPDGSGEPRTTIQKQLFKNWTWIKHTLSTAFTNARSNLKVETTRLFFALYGIKPLNQVRNWSNHHDAGCLGK